MASKLVCEVCLGETFVLCEYVAPRASFGALECTKCRAITLDEDLARTPEERESVREMLAARAKIYCDGQVWEPRASQDRSDERMTGDRQKVVSPQWPALRRHTIPRFRS